MKRFLFLMVLVLAFLVLQAARPSADRPVVIGSKEDVEGSVLAEIMAQLMEDRGHAVERRFALGGTLICFEALKNRAVDLYPEYSGTLEQEILKVPGHTPYARLQVLMKDKYGMDLLDSFGFENTYALAVTKSVAGEHHLAKISDLAGAGDLRYGLSHEFKERQDGWPGLAALYRIKADPVGIEHGLAYQALQAGKLDVTDVYTTDGDIQKYDLVLLEDDRHYFPEYLAAPLARGGLDSQVQDTLRELAGRIPASRMQQMNGMVVLDHKDFAEVAGRFLAEEGLLRNKGGAGPPNRWTVLLGYTATHLRLSLIALLAAVAVAVPLGILVYRLRALARPVIYVVGMLQTIPSLALMAFMIPLFGIGSRPAVIALFLYALLPILRNTATALFSIDPVLRKVSVGMGLTAWQRLRYVELPLAAPTILAGIKTAAVLTIGMATLAALIGAGGLGQPIVTGLAVKNPLMILEGAVPVALLAIVTEFAFEGLEKMLIPRHLLQKAAE